MGDQTIYNDQTIACEDCKSDFEFTAGEQKFYTEKGFKAPKRCKECRNKRQQKSFHDAKPHNYNNNY